MKTIAFYLPQFHTIPENNKWWGDDYTEWTAVKNAKALYNGHSQPKTPYKQRYYNLLDKDTMLWQASIMEKYGVDGLCFYHYYFKGGKKVLEKPAENLLKWKDINMPFCFSWANESWARTWSAIGTKNVWNCIEEEKQRIYTQNEGILLKQEYGNEIDWRIHFEYLLPFFNDDRYIKYENSPVFIIHRADDIPCLPQMLEFWDALAKENGFDGIYVIGSNANVLGLNAYIRQEANYSDTFNELRISYDMMKELVIKNALVVDTKTYLCGFPAYDDTPRRGESGKIIDGSTPIKFYDMMKNLYAISDYRKQEYIFINAWNEWGEGMYLEPDTDNGYSYLEALKKAQIDYRQITIDEIKKRYTFDLCEIRKLQLEIEKHKHMSRVLGRLAKYGNVSQCIESYLRVKSIKSIALYGYGDIAKTIEIYIPIDRLKYIIDKNSERVKSKHLVYGLKKGLPNVDLIVVCLPNLFYIIYKELKSIINTRIISIDQFLDELE